MVNSVLIKWDKPRKIRSAESRAKMYSSDSGVPGTYVPNMSVDDMKSWKGKVVGMNNGHPQVEIRKHPFLMIVSVDGGYKYKFYTPENTGRFNVHISSAGPIQLTFDEWEEMKLVVEEAKEKLRSLRS
jgi:hypothetical protein